MQFLMTVTSHQSQTPPTPELMAAIGALTEKTMKAGVMLQTGGMQMGTTTMSLGGGKVRVVDGPFSEAKELVGGYALVEVKSREEALTLAREFLEVHAKIMGRPTPWRQRSARCPPTRASASRRWSRSGSARAGARSARRTRAAS